MKLNTTFRSHARFATQLKRRSREMFVGLHDESNAYAMRLAGIHIAQLGRLAAELERRLAAAEAANGENHGRLAPHPAAR